MIFVSEMGGRCAKTGRSANRITGLISAAPDAVT